jgi:hypothetical protein
MVTPCPQVQWVSKKLVNRALAQLCTAIDSVGGGGVTDHGALTGLADDDHTQYLNNARGDARYSTKAHKHPFDVLLDGYGFIGATGDPIAFGATGTPGATDHLIGFVPVQPGASVGGVRVAANNDAASYSAGATPAEAVFYDFDGVELGRTADDAAMWLTAGWHDCLLDDPFTAPSDGRLFVGVSFGGFTGAKPLVQSASQHNNVVAGLVGGRRRAIFASSSSGLPASFNPASYGGPTVWYPCMGVLKAD